MAYCYYYYYYYYYYYNNYYSALPNTEIVGVASRDAHVGRGHGCGDRVRAHACDRQALGGDGRRRRARGVIVCLS